MSTSISPRPAFAMENPDMNGSLWSRLPEELIQRVLARLPAARLQVRLRTVCTTWSELMSNKCFLEACSEVASYEAYFVKISISEHSRSLVSFDPSTHRWGSVPYLSHLPPKVSFPVSSSGGLMCFTNNLQASLRDGSVLFVSNPLTKTWKELPRLHCERWPMLVSIIMWKRPHHYKVIVAGGGSTEIFDSIEGKWRNSGCLPRGEENLGLRNVTAYCNGSLYCLTSSNRDLLAFSIQEKTWSKVKTDSLPGYCQFRNLVTCKGHIVIVGKCVRKQVQWVCVWLLEWTTMKWREAGRMPQAFYSENFPGHPSAFHCCSQGDLIFLTSGKCRMGRLYNMAQDRWCSVEAWPNLVNGLSFEPRLDSQV